MSYWVHKKETKANEVTKTTIKGWCTELRIKKKFLSWKLKAGQHLNLPLPFLHLAVHNRCFINVICKEWDLHLRGSLSNKLNTSAESHQEFKATSISYLQVFFNQMCHSPIIGLLIEYAFHLLLISTDFSQIHLQMCS